MLRDEEVEGLPRIGRRDEVVVAVAAKQAIEHEEVRLLVVDHQYLLGVRRGRLIDGVPCNLDDGYGVGDAFQLELAERAQLQAGPGADELTDQLCGEDLPSLSDFAETLGHHDPEPVVIAVLRGAFAGVDADLQTQSLVAVPALPFSVLLHSGGAVDGVERTAERNHQAIAGRLYLLSAVVDDHVAEMVEVIDQDPFTRSVADPADHLGGPGDVGEQHRDGAAKWHHTPCRHKKRRL